MKAKTVKEVLVATKWILDHHGWVQGTFTKVDSNKKLVGFCLVGALDTVEVEGKDYILKPQAYSLMQNELSYLSLSAWNDLYGRTKEQVLSLIDQAIERAT
jgi:hypothetical protein